MSVSYADPAVLDRVRLCTKKQAYGSEDRGWEICKKVYRRFGDLMMPFKCGFCDKWHVGHPRNPRLQAELRVRCRAW